MAYPKESLQDRGGSLEQWISEEVRRRWDQKVGQLQPNCPVGLPLDKVASSILGIVSNQTEAGVVLDGVFNYMHLSETDGLIDSDHHSPTFREVLSVTRDIDTKSAVNLSNDPESLYQLLVGKIDPDIKTTEKVVSKLFNPEIASVVRTGLDSVPASTAKTSLQKKVVQLLREKGVGKFLVLCLNTASILERGAYLVEEGGSAGYLDHHLAGPVSIAEGVEPTQVKKFRPESLGAAEQYLKDNGVLEQDLPHKLAE